MIPSWPLASGSLLLGFAVAQASGVRALGAIVLAAGLASCVVLWLGSAGRGRTAALAILYVLAFAGSHALADLVGAWPAVLVAAGVTGLAAWALADAQAPRRGPGAPRPRPGARPQS